jgi:hypothetical protein
MCHEFHFASIPGLGGSVLSKKVKLVVPYYNVYNLIVRKALFVQIKRK